MSCIRLSFNFILEKIKVLYIVHKEGETMKQISDFLNLNKNEFDKEGAFDTVLDLDAPYFINIKMLQYTKIPEFEESYNKINDFFRKIMKLLKKSKKHDDLFYRQALRNFNIGEVNGIGLGYSKGKHGSGIGPKLISKILSDAKIIIDAGIDDPEFFHLIGLFQPDVGPDRLSDMFANLILEDIKRYTIRINKKFGICKTNYPEKKFKDEFLINPYKNIEVLLLPKEILHKIPIAEEWHNVNLVAIFNQNIRNQVNEIIGEIWKDFSTLKKKENISEIFRNNPVVLSKVITDYIESNSISYDFENDELGFLTIARKLSELKLNFNIPNKLTRKKPMQHVLDICDYFKNFIENNKGYELLFEEKTKKPRKELSSQLLFFAISQTYCETHNLDISPETNSGRGPVDFKISRGSKEKILVEMKLTTNSKLVHGFTTQIKEYAKAERTNKLILLVIDNGGPPKRLQDLRNEYLKHPIENRPELILIDAKPKDSASKF